MILQRLNSIYGISFDSVLMKEYKRLGLKMKELNVLLILFSYSPKRRYFSINAITKKSDYNQNEVAEIINSLLEKDFLTLTLETSNDKVREIFSLDKTLEKLTELFIEDSKKDLVDKNKSKIGETIELLELKYNRLLKDIELDRVRLWYEQFAFDHQKIVDAIKGVRSNATVLYIEKILEQNFDSKVKLDSETEKVLDKIFKGL